MNQELSADSAIPNKCFSVNLTEAQKELFWGKVEKGGEDDCWPWNACKRDGYGAVWIRGKMHVASRIILFLKIGPFPQEMKACHTCDNPECCNPLHIWLGSAADNMSDRDEKGRYVNGPKPQGEAHFFAKLTDEQVLLIRKRYAEEDISERRLAAELGLTRGSVRYVLTVGWKHLPHP